MPDYAVSTAFLGVDKVSALFGGMEKAAGRFGRESEDAFNKASRGADHTSTALRNATKHGYDFGAVFKGILAAHAVRDAVGVVRAGIHRVVSDFINFEDVMVGAGVRFKDIGANADHFEDRMKNMGVRVRKIGEETGTPFVELAHGLNELAVSKFDSESAVQALAPLVRLNLDAQGEFGETTKSVVDTMGAWNMVSDNAGKNISNLTNVVDSLARARVEGRASIAEIAETMKQSGPLARAAGYSFNDMLGMTVLLGRAGIRGHEATTMFKNGILNLTQGARMAELKANGVKMEDAMGNYLRFPEILRQIHEKTKNLGTLQQSAIQARLFGKWGVAGNIDIMRQLGDLDNVIDKLDKAKGFSNEVADKLLQDKLNRLKILGNILENKALEVFDAFSENGNDGLASLIDKVKRFDMQPIIDGLSAAGKVAGILYDTLAPFAPLLPWIAAGWLAWNGVLKVMALGRTAMLIWSVGAALVNGLGGALALQTAMEALGVTLIPVATALAGIAASVAVLAAAKSLFTGKDNFISEWAQDMGLVPKLDHDKAGHVTGYAPNQGEADAKVQGRFLGRLDIAGAPPGSKLSTSNSGLPMFDARLLGLQGPAGAIP